MQYKESFKEFDFSRDFEAVVIDNTDFDEKYEVKLFVYELIMTKLQDSPRNIKRNLNINNIINVEDLDVRSQVDIGNYLICQPLMNNDLDKPLRKPNLYDKVILKFHNGNPKFPYYYDMHLPRKYKPEEPIISNNRNLKGSYYRLLMYREDNMKGNDVNTVGIALTGLGYSANKYDSENYVFDRTMLSSLLQFQSDNNLKQDGDVGPITFNKLIEKYNSISYC
ncbi:peptidoglycan-binding protein [Staphylococcus phage Machias]|nr:peptidoglycan-binding protein [Staphylococcus phage Machias]